jgi:general stress protein YciG
MSPEKQKEIASKGGIAAHRKGTAHVFTPEEARAAGKKGGRAAQSIKVANQAAAGIHKAGTSWMIGNAVILGNDPATCDHIYSRTRGGHCQGCGSTDGQYPGDAPQGDAPRGEAPRGDTP